jgi:hypothetical protein
MTQWKQLVLLVSIGALGVFVRLARAMDLVQTDTSLLTEPTAGNVGQGLSMLIFLAVTAAVIVTIVKVNEFRSKREEEAIALQTRIDDALLEIPGLLNSSVTPTVHIPAWRGSPAWIALSGNAPTLYLEQVALRVTAQAAARVRPDFTIENRMTVVPRTGTRTAGTALPERAQLAGTKGERTWQTAASHLRS